MTRTVEFLEAINKSYEKYKSAGPRSTEKLHPLHGCIAKHLQQFLGNNYKVYAQGIGDGRERKLRGRYYQKSVDIAVEKDDRPLAAIEVKFVQSSFKKNATNYFENMLGQTANIRSNRLKEYQIFILPIKIPLFDRMGWQTGVEEIGQYQLEKYVTLANDDEALFFHTPDKTLVFLLDFKNGQFIEDRSLIPENCGVTVIFNQYEDFLEKVCYGIMSV